jgi:hypothetical protein
MDPSTVAFNLSANPNTPIRAYRELATYGFTLEMLLDGPRQSPRGSQAKPVDIPVAAWI